MKTFNFSSSRFSALIGVGLIGLTLSAAAEARDISIFGSPATTSSSGRAYSFTPATTGDVGRKMQFSIANKPAWATFSVYNGTIGGTPTAANAGTYSRVVVSVTDGKTKASLPAFNLTVTGGATTANHAPTITGAPITSINSGQAYNFVPKAQDADGNKLNFTISSKPSWASFDTSTGRLSGVPTAAQVGSYEEIKIGVSDGKSTASLSQFAVEVVAVASTPRSVALSWQPPLENSDGSALTDLSGYRVMYGVAKGQYTSSVKVSNSGVSRLSIDDLPAGTYYFTIVSVNSAGTESVPSKEVSVELS